MSISSTKLWSRNIWERKKYTCIKQSNGANYVKYTIIKQRSAKLILIRQDKTKLSSYIKLNNCNGIKSNLISTVNTLKAFLCSVTLHLIGGFRGLNSNELFVSDQFYMAYQHYTITPSEEVNNQNCQPH